MSGARSVGAASVALALLTLVAGCKDDASKATASAAPSASAPPRCSEALPQPERVARCEKGEALCCTAMMAGIQKDAPDYWAKLALACAGGSESSCAVVRDSEQPTLYKLDAFAKACTVMGRWPCRMSAMLAVLVAPDRAPGIVENYCRQTDDKTFRIGGKSVRCDPADKEGLAELAPTANACRGGDIASCKSLADIDGGARELFYDVAWEARGLPRETVEKHRVKPTEVGSVEAKGRVGIRVTDMYGKNYKDLADALATLDEPMRRCVAHALEQEEKVGGKLELSARLDKTGRLATTEVKGEGLKSELLTLCLRGVLQDAVVAAEAIEQPWTVELTVSR